MCANFEENDKALSNTYKLSGKVLPLEGEKMDNNGLTLIKNSHNLIGDSSSQSETRHRLDSHNCFLTIPFFIKILAQARKVNS